jgi:hypothetical protein
MSSSILELLKNRTKGRVNRPRLSMRCRLIICSEARLLSTVAVSPRHISNPYPAPTCGCLPTPTLPYAIFTAKGRNNLKLHWMNGSEYLESEGSDIILQLFFHHRRRDQRYDVGTEWRLMRSRWPSRGRNRPQTARQPYFHMALPQAISNPLGFLTGERMIVSAERRHDRHRKSRHFIPHKNRQTFTG